MLNGFGGAGGDEGAGGLAAVADLHEAVVTDGGRLSKADEVGGAGHDVGA